MRIKQAASTQRLTSVSRSMEATKELKSTLAHVHMTTRRSMEVIRITKSATAMLQITMGRFAIQHAGISACPCALNYPHSVARIEDPSARCRLSSTSSHEQIPNDFEQTRQRRYAPQCFSSTTSHVLANPSKENFLL